VLVLISKNEDAIPAKPLIPGNEEIKEKELESESDDHILINIERNSMFDRLSKQSEDELQVYIYTCINMVNFFVYNIFFGSFFD
jgi:hypothetical protein